ncbi:MAG: TerD family protein [Alphaproteobacteria bacterium]|nr:TerD family protein [Alphaproteobacteria bacterium]
MPQEVALNFSSDDRKINVGLEWDPNEEAAGVLGEIKPHNLDLSCAILSADMIVRDIITPTDTKRDVYKDQIFHKGDHTSGGSDFEDEEILINLDNVSSDVGALALTVSTNDQVDIAEVKNGVCRFMDASSLSSFLDVSFDEFVSHKDAINRSSQQHFLAGVLVKKKEGWALYDMQSMLSALDSTSIEMTIKSMVA